MATTIKSSALDFNNIKNNLKTYLANRDQFKDYNFEASGLSNILDVLAYNTHINGLIANFALNESFLGTAQLRSSMVSLAEGIGYIPDSVTASSARVRIFFNTSTSPRDQKVVLPAYTQFTASVDNVTYTFQTIEAYYATDDGTGFYQFETADGSNQIPIYQGTRKTKTFLVGEYEDNPVYVIPDTTLDIATTSVKVYENVSATQATPYINIQNVSSISANSTIYILKESPNGYYELSFGDGETFGIAPAAGNKITVDYLSTVGEDANSASRFTPTAQYVNVGDVSTLTATLNVTTIQSSAGGRDVESIESIRQKAPFQYAAQNRMVTAADYTGLIQKQYGNYITDIISWGGENALKPEFGAVYSSIKFNDNLSEARVDDIKLSILALAKQLAISSFNLRFIDPVTTYIEVDVYYQFNPRLTDQTINSISSSIRNVESQYFSVNTGKFGQSFRRSNLLTLVDDVDNAVLSSRANVRMQQRFVPTTPNIINVINSITLGIVTDRQMNVIVNNVVQRNYDGAAQYIVNQGLAPHKTFTEIRTALSDARNTSLQELLFPVGIAVPDDDTYTVTSSQFVYQGNTCIIRNKLSSNTLQIVTLSGRIMKSTIGSYDPGTGRVSIDYFRPSSIGTGVDYIKLSVVPENQSAITPVRNELLVYDPNASSINVVTTYATN